MSEVKNSEYYNTNYEDYSDEEEKIYTFSEFISEMTSCIDEKWESLTRYVRVNGNKIESLCGETKGSFYENGLIISKNENGYTVEDITSENREIKLSSFSEFENSHSLYRNHEKLLHLEIIS